MILLFKLTKDLAPAADVPGFNNCQTDTKSKLHASQKITRPTVLQCQAPGTGVTILFPLIFPSPVPLPVQCTTLSLGLLVCTIWTWNQSLAHSCLGASLCLMRVRLGHFSHFENENYFFKNFKS